MVFAVSIHVANPRTECADKSRAVTIIYRATKVRNFICLYINFVQTLQCLFGVFRVCDVSQMWDTACEMVKGDGGSSLDNFFNPWFHLVDIGVHTIFVWLSARLSPTHDASQRPNAATDRAGQRSPRVKMTRVHAAFLVACAHESVTEASIVGSRKK